ncbi:MAG: transcriptional regulator [Candidatus Asgardarchaeia archaeon]
MNDDMLTRREKIIRILLESKNALTIKDLSVLLDERNTKLIAEDLKHIAKTVKKLEGGRYRLVMVPAECKKCGYVFTKAYSLTPSKCPKCKSEWISPPKFKIVIKK